MHGLLFHTSCETAVTLEAESRTLSDEQLPTFGAMSRVADQALTLPDGCMCNGGSDPELVTVFAECRPALAQKLGLEGSVRRVT